MITTLKGYEAEALQTAIYPKAFGPIYPALKLAGEAGEVAEKIGKGIREGKIVFGTSWDVSECPDCGEMDISAPYAQVVVADEALKYRLLHELGDVLWYVTALANELGYTLRDVANTNLLKLADRAQRGVLQGEGDAR